MHITYWELTDWEVALYKKALKAGHQVDHKSAMCLYGKESANLGCIRQSSASKLQDVILPLCLALLRLSTIMGYNGVRSQGKGQEDD